MTLKVPKRCLMRLGWPRGADGIRFKTVLNSSEGRDISYQELVSGYWRQIGIQVEIKTVDSATATAKRDSGEFEGFWAWGMARRVEPISYYSLLYSKSGVYTWMGIADPVYDALYEAAVATSDIEEQKRLSREMGIRAVEMHWGIWGTEVPHVNANWPWLKGYNGEFTLGFGDYNSLFAYLWIDQDLKKAMGY